MVKKIFKPAPMLTPVQKRELVKKIAMETEPQIKPIEEIPIEPLEEPVKEIFKKKTPLEIKSSILKSEEGSILTRNKNIFFKE